MYSFYVGNVRELGIMGINDDLCHISFYSLLPLGHRRLCFRPAVQQNVIKSPLTACFGGGYKFVTSPTTHPTGSELQRGCSNRKIWPLHILVPIASWSTGETHSVEI